MIEEGLVITAIGMGAVFIFLGILVLTVRVVSLVILRLERGRAAASPATMPGSTSLGTGRGLAESPEEVSEHRSAQEIPELVAVAIASAYREMKAEDE